MNQFFAVEALQYGTIKPTLSKWWNLSEYEIYNNLDEIMADFRQVSGRDNLDNIGIYLVARADLGCVLSKIILAEITPANRPRVNA